MLAGKAGQPLSCAKEQTFGLRYSRATSDMAAASRCSQPGAARPPSLAAVDRRVNACTDPVF